MLICVVCDVLGKENNGTTIAAMNLIRALRAKGHRVRVVCPDAFRKKQEDVFVVRTLNLGPLNNYVSKNGVVIARSDKEVLKKALDGVDHVHIMLPFFMSRTALKMAREQGLSVTAGFHCQAENFTSHVFLKDCQIANHLTYREFYRHFYRYVDAVHYPTEFIRGVFEQYGGKTDAYVISNGVSSDFQPMEVKRPKKLEGKKVILFTGRYSKEKSHKVLIEAVRKSRYEKEIQLIFAGTAP